MAVFRIERTRDYTVMSNHHLRNHELSLKAKGLLSPEFLNRAGSKDHDRLMNLLPFRSLSFTGMKGLPGTYATILASEDRSKELRQPRPSREHLKQEPKQAAPKAPGHKKREPER